MNIDFLVSVLNTMKSPTRIHRSKAAHIVLQQPILVEGLVNLTFTTSTKLSIKAAWVLEWICTHHGINYIHPYLTIFTSTISELRLASVIRPCAKICEHLAIAYTSKKDNETKNYLTNSHIELIIETGFDWLLGDQKIAVKAYTMNTLFLLGKTKDWVHTELMHLITSKIIYESKGCEARGRKILDLIDKLRH